jgi:serine/threonine protein phosphatase PrpC
MSFVNNPNWNELEMNTRMLVQKSQVEDHPARDGLSENHHVSLPARGIFVVADGVGGPVVGKGAARAACEGVVEFLTREAGDRDATLPFVLRNYFSLAGNVLFNSMIHANRKVLALNEKRSVNEKGAASVLAGYVDRETLALASVGAVTAWLKRGNGTVELVRPRTWGALMDPTRRHAGLGLVSELPLMAMGVELDLEPEILEVRLAPGDELCVLAGGRGAPFEVQLNQSLETNDAWVERFSLKWVFSS